MGSKRVFVVGLVCVSLLWQLPAMLHAETEPVATAAVVETAESLKDAATNAIKNKDWTSALSLLDRYLQLKPDDAYFYRKQGFVLGELGRNEEAITSYQRAVELAPSSSGNWNGLCWHQILAGAFGAAQASCEKAVALDPTEMVATVNLGHTYLLQGDVATAQEWYQKTLVNIESDEDLQDGPLADFDIFIAKNWQVKESVQAKAWFAEEGALWLERSEPVRQLLAAANAAKKEEDTAQVIVLLEERLPLLIALIGENHPRIATSLNNLAGLHYNQGQYAQAEPLYNRALAIREKAIGPEHPDTANSLNNLAGLYQSQGQYTQAEPLYKRALAISEKTLGPEHPDMATRLDNLAGLYETQGQYAQAEPLYNRALAIREKAIGPEHPDTATSLNKLAGLYRSQGQYAQAEPLYKRALAISEKALGPEHPDTATSLNNLAGLYQSQGQYAQAEPLYKRALAIREKALGPEHTDTATILDNLAGLYKAQGQYAQAEPLYKRALAISEKALGPDHFEVAGSLFSLAGLYETQGQYVQAESLYKRSLAIFEKMLGPEHPDMAASLNILARLHQTQGKYAQAEVLLKRSLAIREKTLGSEHPDIATSLIKLASLYEDQGQYAQAESLCKRALAIREKALGPEHPDTAISLNKLAGLYETQGQYAQAELLYKRALAIREKALGPDHPDVANNLDSLAWLYDDTKGQYAQAESLIKRALAIREKALGQEHPDTAASLNHLAWLYTSHGQYALAEPLYKQTLAIKEKALGTEHPRLAIILNTQARLYTIQGQYAQAEPLIKRALAISEKALGPDHPDVVSSLKNLAWLYINQGQYAQAEPLLLRAWRIAGAAGKPALAWHIQEYLCKFYSKSKPDLAIWYGKQAINTLQTVRANNAGIDKDLQTSFLKMNENTYKAVADLLFTQGRMMEGQQVLAMLKESEYFDFIQRSTIDDPRKTTANYTNREKPWSERYETISSQLAALSKEYQTLSKREEASHSAAEKTKMAQLDADLTIGRQAYDDFMVELQREFSQTATADRQQEFGKKNLDDLSALQGTLGELGHGAVTLHYLMTDKRLWILLTTPTVQLKQEAAINEANLNGLIGQYREAIARRDPKVKELGKALYDLIIGPVSEDLKQAGAQTLMLSLDGAMRYLPMAALYDGEKFLVEKYRLVTYTEAAKDKLKDNPLVQWKFAGFGLTDKLEGYDELKAVKEELEGIAADAMDGEVKFNKDFTSASFKSALAKSPPVVHLSSHFVFNVGTNEDSFLLLGDGNKLSLKQIKDGGYKFTNVDLVTLSACETAVGGGKDENGREVEGFGALAQKQGAKGVLATLWKVNDQSTGQFMQLLYGFRQKNLGMTKAEAMQKAQLAFIKGQVGPALAEVSRGKVIPTGSGKTVAVVTTTDHPYYWAPFILMGNWL